MKSFNLSSIVSSPSGLGDAILTSENYNNFYLWGSLTCTTLTYLIDSCEKCIARADYIPSLEPNLPECGFSRTRLPNIRPRSHENKYDYFLIHFVQPKITLFIFYALGPNPTISPLTSLSGWTTQQTVYT